MGKWPVSRLTLRDTEGLVAQDAGGVSGSGVAEAIREASRIDEPASGDSREAASDTRAEGSAHHGRRRSTVVLRANAGRKRA